MKVNVILILVLIVAVSFGTLMLKRSAQTQENLIQMIKLQQKQLDNIEKKISLMPGAPHA